MTPELFRMKLCVTPLALKNDYKIAALHAIHVRGPVKMSE
jgi:hypothetical protein